MTVDEFVRRAAAQPTITQQHRISLAGPELRALRAEGTHTVAELMAHPDQRWEMRTSRYGHVLGLGVHIETLDAWRVAHPSLPLPEDLVELLQRVNGIHLWADLDTGRAYFGISPMDEWCDARDAGWAMMVESPPAGQLVLSYHQDGGKYVVLDTTAVCYRWFDLGNFDHPKTIGGRVDELLEFWWRECQSMDPRGEQGAADHTERRSRPTYFSRPTRPWHTAR